MVNGQNPIPLLDLGRENGPLHEEILQAIAQIMRQGSFVLGPAVQELEEAIATRCGTKHAVGCASGSDALLLALMAIDLKPHDEVILPSFTFFATASAISRLGGKPVFVDIEPDTFNLDPDCVRQAVTSNTRAIIPVHLFGQCANLPAIQQIADEFNLEVIEDCAQSIDAMWGGAAAGSMGRCGCFSFYPTKNLGGFGDGGLVTTNCDEFADKLRLYRAHGMRPRYTHHVVGINSRLDSIQAIVIQKKLAHLNLWTQQRQSHAARYEDIFGQTSLLQSTQITLPTVASNCSPVWNQYTIRVHGGRRDFLRNALSEQGIGTGVYYPIPLHLQPCFSGLGYQTGSLPITEQAAGEVLSLPVFPELTQSEQQRVVAAIESTLVSAVRQAA